MARVIVGEGNRETRVYLKGMENKEDQFLGLIMASSWASRCEL